MTSSPDSLSRWLPVLSTSIPLIILPITILVLPLSAAEVMGLSRSQITNWILALYGIPSILGMLLSLRYQLPLLTTGNIFALLFILSLGDQFSFAEITGAFIITGVGVLLVSLLGLTAVLAAWIPTPVVLGLLAGSIMPLFAGIFTAVGEAPLTVGSAFIVYLLSRRFLGERLPPIFPALVTGLTIAALTGQIGVLSARPSLPIPKVTPPIFSPQAIVTITPVLLAVVIIQSNLPSMVFLRSQTYRPPERVVDLVSGTGTILGSLLGPTAISLSLPATAIAAGPGAGETRFRHRSIYIAGTAVVLLALLAGLAAELPQIIPTPLLLALAGMAVIEVFIRALQDVTRGPLLLGPVFAFAIAFSDISLFGLGAYFWSLVIGTGVTLLIERDELRKLREEEVK